MEETTISIPLLNEGTPVLRPAQARAIAPDLYLVAADPNYDPDDEDWAFPPGTTVRVEVEVRDGEKILVAKSAEA